MWLKVVRRGSKKRLYVVKSGFRWLKVILVARIVVCGQKWFYVVLSGSMRLRVVLCGPMWFYVVKSDFVWLKVVICG